MKNKIVFSSSGGATKFVSILEGMRIAIQERNIIPTDLVGISAGAIASFITSVAIKNPSLFSIALKTGLELNMSDMFSVPPVNDKGQMKYWSILLRLLQGKNSLGEQDIKKLFTNHMTPSIITEWLNDPETPNVWVMTVRPRDFKRKLVNIKNPDFKVQDVLNWVSASSHIPVFAQPIEMYDEESNQIEKWVDGGLRNHNPSPKFIDEFGPEIKELYTFYSRANTINLRDQPDWDKNVITILSRVLQGMSLEISKRDSQYEIQKQKEFGYKLKQFFYPGYILESQYDVNKSRLFMLYSAAQRITREGFLE